MDWRGRRGSRNIEDRRSSGGGGRAIGGVGGVGALAIVVIGYFLGVDLTPLLGTGGGQFTGEQGSRELTAAEQEVGQFVSVTLADTEEVWARLFKEQLGRQYQPVTLVMFSGATQSACGTASAGTGPFYCPPDNKIYLDPQFFVTMDKQLGAKGDFASAYVVAHEVAHHVQDQLGILGEANQIRQRVSERDSNAISVRIELQADCLSGVWARGAHEQFGSIEAGDFEEALNAARQIGDDTLQRNAGQTPSPHSFTHGTSEQRSRWFATGVQSGRIETCDTFSANSL